MALPFDRLVVPEQALDGDSPRLGGGLLWKVESSEGSSSTPNLGRGGGPSAYSGMHIQAEIKA